MATNRFLPLVERFVAQSDQSDDGRQRAYAHIRKQFDAIIAKSGGSDAENMWAELEAAIVEVDARYTPDQDQLAPEAKPVSPPPVDKTPDAEPARPSEPTLLQGQNKQRLDIGPIAVGAIIAIAMAIAATVLFLAPS